MLSLSHPRHLCLLRFCNCCLCAQCRHLLTHAHGPDPHKAGQNKPQEAGRWGTARDVVRDKHFCPHPSMGPHLPSSSLGPVQLPQRVKVQIWSPWTPCAQPSRGALPLHSLNPFFLFFSLFPSVTDTIPSAEKPRAHLTGNACSIPKRSPRALQLSQCKNLGLYGSDRIRCCKKQGRNSHQLCLAQRCRFNTAVSVGKGPHRRGSQCLWDQCHFSWWLLPPSECSGP